MDRWMNASIVSECVCVFVFTAYTTSPVANHLFKIG